MARQRPWIIEDCAIASPDQDRFDHQSVSRELLDIVRGSTQPLAIGLLGPFGSGKSSVVRLLAAELKDDPKWAILHLSAERHSGSARARGLLYGLLDEAWRQDLIGLEQWKAERACLDGGRQRTAPRPTAMSAKPGKQSWYAYPAAAGAALGWLLASLATIWLLGVAVVAFSHLGGIAADVPAWTWFAAPGARPLTTALSGAAVVACVLGTAKDGALSSLRRHEITLTTPRAESTDDLEQVFSGLIDTIDRRLVIAIDDIDRLAASEVLDALTTVRSLLLTGTYRKHPPVFLLSCDEDIIREAIVGVRPGLAHRPAQQSRHDGNSVPTRAAERKATEEAAQEYLNKLFTVRLVLPAHHDADLRQYIEHLLTHPTPHELVARLGGITAVRDVLETLIHPEVRDPRHAIRLLNAFLADYGLAIRREQDNGAPAWIASGEVTGHPITLGRLTVLRHDYRTLYDAICAEHDLLALLDDALLGSSSALFDPLLTAYVVSEKADDSTNSSESDSTETIDTLETSRTDDDALPRLDTARHPGLRYLRATAARARTGRPEHLMPLLTLGSTPASRALGSDQAAAIQRELLQRDADALRDRLTVIEIRERVLLAATHALESARPGQDLDNTLAAAVEALSRTPGLADHLNSGTDPVGRALLNLTDRIASRRTEMRAPIPAHHLVGILDLVPPAHLPSLYTSLSTPPSAESGNTPAAEQPAFAWAQALIVLPNDLHSSQLRPALEAYFRTLAGVGGAEELKAWLVDYNESSTERRMLWPQDAYRALLAMATRAADRATVQETRQVIETATSYHLWQRPVMLGVLTWLSSDNDPLRVNAVELLRQRAVPADEWGSATAEGAAFGATLATELLEHAADFLSDDEEAASSEQTAELLHRWLQILGDRITPSGRQVSAVVAETLAQTAHTCSELAAAAARILPDLQQQDAAACAIAIAESIAAPAASDNAVANALAEALLVFMQVRTDDPTVQEAARTSQKALTAGFTGDDVRGTFARRHLAAVMSTDAGREAGIALVDEFTPRLTQHHVALSRELFSCLHTLLDIPATRTARLGQVLKHLYNRMSTQPAENAGFAAHYAADQAVTTQWLTWITQHWTRIPDHERSLALAAAPRPDLDRSNGLPDLLAQHLLDTTETEPWQHAADLWPTVDPDRQAALLVAADGRCPTLAEQAAQASTDVLIVTLRTANVTAVPAVVDLISANPQATQAIRDYLDDAIAGREWTEEHAVLIATACPAPGPLWEVLLTALSKGPSTVERVSPLIAALLMQSRAAAPRTIVDEIAPILREATVASATALGHAVRPAPELATALRRTLHGHSKTAAEKERTAAFKQAAGIR